MSQKITISVSDELYDRLDKVKNCFNVSRLCQGAIEHEATRYELLEACREEENMDKVIERLRLEKEETKQEYHDMGYQEALKEDAKDMHYTELTVVANLIPSQYALDIKNLPDAIVDWMADRFDEYREDDKAFDQETYLQGWCEGVAAFFEQVRDKLKL